MKTKLIKQTRDNMGITAEDMFVEFKKAGGKGSISTYIKWENDKSDISFKNLEILAKVLGKKVQDFSGLD